MQKQMKIKMHVERVLVQDENDFGFFVKIINGSHLNAAGGYAGYGALNCPQVFGKPYGIGTAEKGKDCEFYFT